MKNLLINRALAAKKKKIFTLFLALVTGTGTMFASNTQMEIGGIWYDFDHSSKTATVTYRGSYYHSYSNEYTGDIVIPASVTINSVSYSVTSIGSEAFRDCSSLTSVSIPNSVTSIGSFAFDGCSSLPVTDNIRYAGTYLVKVVDKTQSSYTIQEGTKWIGSNAFQDCNTMTSVTIPNSVTSIGSRAFEGCTGLTTMTIPNSVTSIGGGAFYGCSSLTSVTIPNSVTSIGGGAFQGCSSLTSITIPNSVKSIEDYAFSGCSSLTSVTIPNSVTSIGKYAFYKCAGLTSVTIGNSVTSIGDLAFWKCTGLNSVTINSQYIVGKTYTSSSNIEDIFGSQVTQYIIGNSVTSIGDYAFYNCSGLTGEFVIPNSVTSIAYQAFHGCTGLTSVTIGNSVTSIGSGAFHSCSGLTSVTIPNSVTSIGGGAFSGCTGLTGEFIIPNSVTSIGEGVFRGCTGLTSVTIGNSVTSIGEYAFYDCAGLTSVTIGNSVTSIGSDAFYNCSSLTSVTINSPDIIGKTYTSSSNIKKIFGSQVTQYIIGNSVTSIGDYAFYECSSLSSVTIGNSVTSIGSHVFAGCVGLTSVIWNAKNYSGSAPDNTPFYGDYYVDKWFQHIKFDLRPQITSFTFGNEVEHIPAYICNGMSNLTSVTIPNSVTSIGCEAFYGCTGLTSVTIPNSVDSIAYQAFHGCTGLTSVTIGNSVTSIGNYAFEGCSSLTSPVYNAHVFAFMPTSYSGAYTIPNGIESIAGGAFFWCDSLTSITIPNSVTSIRDYAFEGCTGLTSVTIGNSVTSIAYQAFRGCTGLTSVTIPNSVTSIGMWAFVDCSELRYIYMIAQTPPSIGSYPFPLNSFSNNIKTRIYVPCNSANDYKASWSGYADYIYAICSSYTINFVNWDGSNLQASQVTYGDMPQYTGIQPTKPSDSQYTYTFAGWTPDIGPAVESTTYKATFTAEPKSGLSYTITFVNWDGRNLQTLDITEGDMPQYTGATPTRPDDSQYTYTFSGWTPQIVAATADATYTATFTAEPITSDDCTDVNDTWLQTGGSGLGEITTDNSGVWIYDAQYGAKASRQGGYTGYLMTPAKDLRGMKSVTLSFMHTHKFAGTPSNELTLWVTPDYKGSVEASQWQQLTIAPYAANTNWTFVSVSINVPVSKVGANTVFAFKYMSTASNYATWEIKNLTLIAQCEGSTPPQPTYYTIKFKNWDGSVLQSTQVEEGQMPQYTGATPTKPSDSQYSYTFSGWTPQIVAATADATYTATFAATKLPTEECGVNATWLQTGGSGLGEITTDNSGMWIYDDRYGAIAQADSGETGWLLTPAKDLSGMKSVNLSFLHVHKNAGTFTDDMTLWVCANYKGSVSASQWQQLTITPYSTNNNWVYVNVSIDVPLGLVGANTVFGFKYISSNGSAKWEIKELNLNAECEGSTPPQPTYYTIKFKNWDGSVLQSTQVEEGQMPQYTGATPTKPSDSQYIYTFSGWTPQIVAATADATYTATFTATEIPSEECANVNDTWLQTGGSGLGEITTDNSGVWKYEYQYGACAKADNSGETGWLLTPAKDLRGMKSVNLSFLHVHKNAGTFTDDMTLWVCANYKGSVSASQWQQLTITPYSTNNNWVFVNVSIDVPLNMVGANTVFGFKYTSSNGSAKWEIKELNLNAECAKADETTTTDVTATPNEDNSVTLTWPAVNGADTYTIEIKKNGVSVCTLVFNANGQLISISFAAPARDGKGRNVPAAEQSANGWTYVVTGLEGNASYTYSVTAKDVNGNVLLKQSVDFSTGEEQGIDQVPSDQVQCTKVIKNGQIFILRGDKTYTLQGQETIMP